MKDALEEVHRKAKEIGSVEPRPEFTPMQPLGMDGFSRCPDHHSRKSYWPWKTGSGGLAVQRGVSASNSQKTSIAGRENPRTRLAMGVDEVKRRRKELNSMRSDLNAYRWRARTERANKKMLFFKRKRILVR